MQFREVEALIGDLVIIEWYDPDVTGVANGEEPLRGKASLARQRDIGILTDVTEGIIRVCHSYEALPGGEFNEAIVSHIVMSLVTRVSLYKEEQHVT